MVASADAQNDFSRLVAQNRTAEDDGAVLLPAARDFAL